MSVKSLTCRVVIGVVLVVGPWAVVPREASAETAAERRRATTLLQEGAKLLDSKDFAAALGKFSEAYALVPSPKIQFNIGLAQEGLDRPAEATRAYQLYLQGATSDTASRRADAQGRIKTLRPRVTHLQITTDVAGATVTVDGGDEGRTPLAQPLVVTPGPHHVVVQGPGGATWTRAIRGEAGTTLDLQPNLQTVALAPPPTTTTPPVAPPPPLPEAQEPASEEPPLVTARPTGPAEDEGTPVYKKVWFWGVVVGVAAAATVSGVLLFGRGTDFPCPMMDCVKAN